MAANCTVWMRYHEMVRAIECVKTEARFESNLGSNADGCLWNIITSITIFRLLGLQGEV